MTGCEAMAKVANTVTNEVGVGNNKKVFLPKTGECVDATTESYIYQVRLPDSLMSQLSFQHAKDNTYLSWVDGALTYQQSGTVINKTKTLVSARKIMAKIKIKEL